MDNIRVPYFLPRMGLYINNRVVMRRTIAIAKNEESTPG